MYLNGAGIGMENIQQLLKKTIQAQALELIGQFVVEAMIFPTVLVLLIYILLRVVEALRILLRPFMDSALP